MVSLQRSDSMLASLILLFLWTICFAQSHDPTPFKLSALHGAKRDLPTESRAQVDKISSTVKDSLSLFKDVMEKLSDKKDTVTQVTKVITSLRNFASLAPGIGALASSIISVVLIFIPEDNPVLNELREGFSEMNRKLDSLSSQISNLATDVEWFNYASVYSQDEVRILHTWKKFSQFFTKFYQSEEDKEKLKSIFIRYYENAGTEVSMDNFYHYLTVSTISLSGNLNNLLRKKFKCDINEISKYNLYFSSLIWKGLVLNEFYWKLIGVNSTGKEAEHTQMLRNIYKAQISTVDYCLNNYEKYMKEDVAEIAKALSPDNKQIIAEEVKEALDKKYNWYNWVVVVYDTSTDYMMNLDMTNVTVGGFCLPKD
ncbi:Cephalotoxin-like protein [Channa argus]|uniref:Cephalotoxin-like protein n=1 Tax=Channa argus TaxID=215402 RepID=A0A6G1Q756_CHAAH|nr:Cephalotoxin-like protein [Channa argus]